MAFCSEVLTTLMRGANLHLIDPVELPADSLVTDQVFRVTLGDGREGVGDSGRHVIQGPAELAPLMWQYQVIHL
jgi:hypothetical protein